MIRQHQNTLIVKRLHWPSNQTIEGIKFSLSAFKRYVKILARRARIRDMPAKIACHWVKSIGENDFVPIKHLVQIASKCSGKCIEPFNRSSLTAWYCEYTSPFRQTI